MLLKNTALSFHCIVFHVDITNKHYYMKKTLYVVAALVILAGIYTTFSSKNVATDKPVKIGVVLPLSGGAAFLGESAQRAALLALKDAGDTKYDYELVIDDDGFNPINTVTVVNKLINIDKVLGIITFGSGTSNAVAPINEGAKVARFGLASDPTSAEGKYNFVHWTPPFKEGALLAQEIVKRGYKTVSIIDTDHAGTLAVTNAIKDSLRDTEVKIVSYDMTKIGDKDFRTIAAKIKNLQPDLIILEMFTPENELMARQLRDLGIHIPLTSVETFEWSNEPTLFNGMWFVSDGRKNPDFVDRYTKEYGTGPETGSTYVYDLVAMMIRLQEESNTRIDPTDLPEIIMQKGYNDSPLYGKTVIDKDGFFVTEASVKKIVDGKAVQVE